MTMRQDHIELLEDKLRLWREAASSGPVDFRDYNRRCAEALEECLEHAIEGRA